MTDPRDREPFHGREEKQLSERSLLGSSFAFNDVGKVSSQTMADLEADDDDD
ncbi:hypothetical protein [Isoptericola rhizosphaerae]|uniref:hypothetical protein n=1 Tax=Isoptericola rhizosphaerae TaxID=3377837 RepID=UPI00383B53FD